MSSGRLRYSPITLKPPKNGNCDLSFELKTIVVRRCKTTRRVMVVNHQNKTAYLEQKATGRWSTTKPQRTDCINTITKQNTATQDKTNTWHKSCFHWNISSKTSQLSECGAAEASTNDDDWRDKAREQEECFQRTSSDNLTSADGEAFITRRCFVCTQHVWCALRSFERFCSHYFCF